MARKVEEVMNRELFSVSPNEEVERTLKYILILGVTSAPVLDQQRRPVGVVSLRDLVNRHEGQLVSDRMTAPTMTIRAQAAIEEAGRLLAQTGYHHLVVVDEEGHAVGFVSALDILRGLLGIPAGHPAAFPHFDTATGLVWTNDTLLDLDQIEVAPDGPGLLVLVRGGAGLVESVVWAESADNVRRRLIDILSGKTKDRPPIEHWRERGRLCFRATALPDPEERSRLLRTVLDMSRGRAKS